MGGEPHSDIHEGSRNATLPAESGPADERADVHGAPYLLVFERDSAWMYQLPESGEVVVGRADTADLRLQDGSVSRNHAKLVLTPREAHVADLNSQNGTTLNGERLSGSRPLVSGDMIGLSGVTLVFHASPRRPAARLVVDPVRFRRRADEELERSLRFGRSFAVLAVRLGRGPADRHALAAVFEPLLRRVDVAAWDGADQVLFLLAETDGDAALARAASLMGALAPEAPGSRAGFAACPADGCDFDTLLASARDAAAAAEPGKAAAAAEAYRTFRIGEREAVVADPAMLRLFALIEQRLASAEMPVLVYGETGTGKELVTSALHHWSTRRHKPLVNLNCAAIPEELVESELFGYEKGAFSGAATSKPGLIEVASGGTLVLDEIADLPLRAQAKLLRVLETKRLLPLGDIQEREVEVRLVAATNRSLDDEVAAGRFRRDLYFRLKGATLWLRPLRDRTRELPILAQSFLTRACERAGRAPMGISAEAMRAMLEYAWPGNVRELERLMDYVAAVAREPVLEIWHLAEWMGGGAEESPEDPPGPAALAVAARAEFRPIDDEIRELEQSRMLAALAASGGHQKQAAELIRMPLRTFVHKLRAYGLTGAARGGRRSPDKP